MATPDDGAASRAAHAAGIETHDLRQRRGALRHALRLRSLVDRQTVDVVIVDSDEGAWSAAVAVRMARRGVVVRRVAAGEALPAGWRSRWSAKLARIGFVFTLPATGADAAPAGPLGVRLAEARDDADEAFDTPPRLICVAGSREAEGRALGEVLRAFALLRRRFPRLRLAIVGVQDRTMQTRARLHAAALRVAEGMDWISDPLHGVEALRRAEIGCVVAGGDDCVYGLLDLMAWGIPVVASRTTLSEHYVADGIHGALLAVMDAAHIASELSAMLASPDGRTAMGHAARMRVQREFSDADMAAPFELMASRLLRRSA